MPWIDISAMLLIVAALIVGAFTRRRSAVPVIAVGTAAVVLLVVAALLEGMRMQVVAGFVAAAVGAAVVLWMRSRTAPRLAVAGMSVAAVGVLGIAAVAWVLPPMSVPAPTGPHAVGVTSHVWTDPTRDARGGSAPGQQRSLPVTIWYPAERAGSPSPYLPQESTRTALTAALAQQYGLPPLLFDGLRRATSEETWEAPAAHGSFPVVIASPGFASTRWFFTSWAEELVSHGIVVIAVDHPYDAAVAELADGTLATDEQEATGDDAADQAAADRAAGVRAADVRAIIDHLEATPSPAPELVGADLTTIIAAGHSAGGATAIEAARLDDRITGVVDIDGMPRSPAGTRLSQPLVAVVAGDMDPNPEYGQALNSLLSGGTGARVTLDGVAHLGMMDAGRLLGPVPGLTGVNGPDGPRRAAQATLTLVTAVETGRPLDLAALRRVGKVQG